MTAALVYALAFYGLAFLTWVFFCALMNAKRVRNMGLIQRPAYVFAYPALGIGYALDFALQLASTFLFLELPRELLLSGRLTRLIASHPTTWRGRLALWFRANFLDNFDPAGIHHG